MFANTISSHGKPSPKHPNAVYSSDLNFSWSDPDLDDTQDGGGSSPIAKSPWNNKWLLPEPVATPKRHRSTTALAGSLVREEGHVYSLATKPGGFLYTGSDSKNIRVWKGLKDYAGFKSSSGLVKAIVIAGEKIFTGHQDGKIRVWKVSDKDPSVHKRSGSLPTFKALLKSSIKPSSYVEAKRRIKHSDAISSLSLAEEDGILYSSSWDRTFKVWRISDSKCIESVLAHEDAVNSVVTAGPETVFTGSADGTVKVWRREVEGKGTRHFLVKTLLKQDCAVTAVAVGPVGTVVYCGSSDGLVSFWSRKRLAYGGALRGHKLAVLCLVAKGRMVFSGSADKSICVWRRDGSAVHTRVAVLSGHSGPVKCLAVEEDEKERWKLYSGSLDKSVKVWRVCEFVD